MQVIKEYYKNKKTELANYIEDHNLSLSLAIFKVGNNPASEKYVKNKIKTCESAGIKCELYEYTENISEEDLIYDLRLANERKNLTGIIVQLPLPKHINEQRIMEAIDPNKDVDGFHKLSKVFPATPQGIITYLEDQNYDFVDKNVVVIGRSNIVGRPIARMLLDRSANVSVIHSKTSHSRKLQLIDCADLIIVATGHRNTLTDEELMIYRVDNEAKITSTEISLWRTFRTCFIVDVGINFTEEGKMVGDCENVTVCEKTPVPSGCGLLTQLAVIENLIKLAE